MGDNQDQEEAEKVFRLKTTKCFLDAGELQELNPHVKRLLQLFPKLKESIKCALSSNDVRNQVYQKQGVISKGSAKAHWN